MTQSVPLERKARATRKRAPLKDEPDEEILAHLPSWIRTLREIEREAESDETRPSDGSR